MKNLIFDEPCFIQLDSFVICHLLGRIPGTSTPFWGLGWAKEEDEANPHLKYEVALQRAKTDLEERALWEVSCNPYKTESDFDPVFYGGR